MKHIAPISLTLCLCLGLTGCGSAQAPHSSAPAECAVSSTQEETAAQVTQGEDGSYSTDLFAMDTFMSMKAYGDNSQAALEDISAMVSDLDSRLSVTKESSEIYALDHAEGQSVTLSDTTADLLNKALALGETTDGALAFTSYPLSRAWGFTTGAYQIPSQDTIDTLLPLVDDTKISLDGSSASLPENAMLDLGSVAKGYAGDRAAEILKEAGVDSALLNLGSSTIRAIGEKPDGSPWRIAIQDPQNTESYAGVVSIRDMAVDTSGGYERYFTGEDGEVYWHIIDPATGYPAKNGLISVTILSNSALQGDGLSTALFVMGLDKAVDYWRQQGDFEFILITDQGEIYVSEGAQDCFEPLGDYQNAAVHVVTHEA